jgi:murein L,D-transpeptidase YcbB/YkuD
LARQGFEFVAGDGRVLTTLSNDNLEAVLRGQLRIRQRPGPKNALGDIKFVFPNNDNIYLHHTPSPAVRAPRRDFSHGCIRVEAPVALAKFVLQACPTGTRRASARRWSGQVGTLRLREPLPVVIAYNTAVANGRCRSSRTSTGTTRCWTRRCASVGRGSSSGRRGGGSAGNRIRAINGLTYGL